MFNILVRIWLVLSLALGIYIYFEKPEAFKDSVVYAVSERYYFESAHSKNIAKTISALQEQLTEMSLNPGASYTINEILQGWRWSRPKEDIKRILRRPYQLDLYSTESINDAIALLQEELASKKNLPSEAPGDIYAPMRDWLVPSILGLLAVLSLRFVGLKSTTSIKSFKNVYDKLSPAQKLGLPMAFVIAILGMATVLILDYTSPVKSCIRKVLSYEHIEEAQRICNPPPKQRSDG